MKIKTGIKVFVFLGAILTFSGSAFAKPTLRTSEFSQKTTQQKKNLENKFKDARERGWPLKDKMLKDQNQKTCCKNSKKHLIVLELIIKYGCSNQT